MVIVKKYSNRRLYDTADSRYVTLEEIAGKIRGGDEVQVLDAKTGEALTQATLAQIILESRGAARLLPVPLLVQLVRLGDEALAEFLGRVLSWALETWLSARQGAQAIAPYNPFATLPFAATSAMARLWSPWGEPPPAPAPPPPPPAASSAEVSDLRRELDELRRELRKRRK